MSVFSRPDFDNHEEVVFHHDRASGLKAIIAVHNRNLGPALGGCRMWPYESDDEAIDDVLRLSKGMTYKAAMAGLDFGGGKSVIIGDPHRDKNDALVLAMGRFIDSLNGRYHSGEDVGMTVGDMDVMRRVTPYAHGVSDGSGNPSPATAWGVFLGIKAAVKHRLDREDLDGVSVAVQGLGSVGQSLCEYLCQAGAKLTVADIDPARVRDVQQAPGAIAVGASEIHRVAADVFAPCALGAGLNDETIPELQTMIVAGSANNQLAESRHGLVLKERGILYAPDYVINAGGVIDIAAEGPDYSTAQVMKRVEGIYDTLMQVFARASVEDSMPEIVADRMAEARFMGAARQAA